VKRMILVGCGALALAACGDATAENSGASADDATEAPAKAADEASGADEGAAQADSASDKKAAAVTKVACASDEQELFSCAAGKKRIAVCGVTNAQGQKTAQYRFGSPGKAEIVLDGGRFANTAYSGGGESQIQFANGGVRYIVYSRTIRTGFDEEGNKPEFTDGVWVVRGDENLADRQCTADVVSVDVMAGEEYGGVSQDIYYGLD
jgi:hypothetical protein